MYTKRTYQVVFYEKRKIIFMTLIIVLIKDYSLTSENSV